MKMNHFNSFNFYFGKLLKNVFLTTLVFIALFPIFWILSLSLRPNQETLGRNPTFLPKKWTFENYLNLFGIDVNTTRMQQLDFDALLNFIINGAIVAVIVTILACFLSILAGYSFSRYSFPGKKILLITILNTQMFPYMAIILPIYVLYSKLDFINTYQGLVIAELGLVLPFSIWMMKGFCDTIDKELEDAAYIETNSKLFILWKIILPIIIPGVVAVSMFCFLASWNHLLYVMLLGTDESIMTVPYGLITKYGGHTSRYTYGLLSAGIVITTAPIVIIFLWFQKYFISGLTSGAVKG